MVSIASKGVALVWVAGELQSLECQSKVVVRLHSENRPQTPTKCQALYWVLYVRFASINQIATRNRNFAKTDVPATKGQFLHKLI